MTVTTATEPLFQEDWIRSGTHISSMGSDSVGKQELPPGLFRYAKLFCDLPDQSRRIGEFQHAGTDLRLTGIGEVLLGRASGRTARDEVTVFDSSGLSLQDLYVARAVIDALQMQDA